MYCITPWAKIMAENTTYTCWSLCWCSEEHWEVRACGPSPTGISQRLDILACRSFAELLASRRVVQLSKI